MKKYKVFSKPFPSYSRDLTHSLLESTEFFSFLMSNLENHEKSKYISFYEYGKRMYLVKGFVLDKKPITFKESTKMFHSENELSIPYIFSTPHLLLENNCYELEISSIENKNLKFHISLPLNSNVFIEVRFSIDSRKNITEDGSSSEIKNVNKKIEKVIFQKNTDIDRIISNLKRIGNFNPSDWKEYSLIPAFDSVSSRDKNICEQYYHLFNNSVPEKEDTHSLAGLWNSVKKSNDVLLRERTKEKILKELLSFNSNMNLPSFMIEDSLEKDFENRLNILKSIYNNVVKSEYYSDYMFYVATSLFYHASCYLGNPVNEWKVDIENSNLNKDVYDVVSLLSIPIKHANYSKRYGIYEERVKKISLTQDSSALSFLMGKKNSYLVSYVFGSDKKTSYSSVVNSYIEESVSNPDKVIKSFLNKKWTSDSEKIQSFEMILDNLLIAGKDIEVSKISNSLLDEKFSSLENMKITMSDNLCNLITVCVHAACLISDKELYNKCLCCFDTFCNLILNDGTKKVNPFYIGKTLDAISRGIYLSQNNETLIRCVNQITDILSSNNQKVLFLLLKIKKSLGFDLFSDAVAKNNTLSEIKDPKFPTDTLVCQAIAEFISECKETEICSSVKEFFSSSAIPTDIISLTIQDKFRIMHYIMVESLVYKIMTKKTLANESKNVYENAIKGAIRYFVRNT